MFSTGTRVYACSSAVTGKKFGPKRHSIGYISGSNSTYYIKYVKNFPIKSQIFMFTPLKIVFTRYGKEEKQRCETRNFLQILPIFNNYKEPETISKLTEQIISIFKAGELSKNSNWLAICSNFTCDSTNIGTIIPVGHIGADKMSKNDTKAWVYSILQNVSFKALIRSNRQLHTLKNLVGDEELLIWLSNAVSQSNTRQDLIAWSEESSKNMKRLVRILQRINTAFNKRMFDYNTMDGKLRLNGSGPNVQTDAFLTWLVYMMFDDKRIITKKGNIIKKATKYSSVYFATARNLESTLSTYLNLKPKHI